MITQAISTAATGIRTSQRIVDSITNNIANVDTPGYRRINNTPYELPGNNKTGAGVGVDFDRGDDASYAAEELRLNTLRMNLAESTAAKEVADAVNNTASAAMHTNAFASFMSAVKDLQTIQNQANQAVVNGTGQDFVRVVSATRYSFASIKNMFEKKITISELQLRELRGQLAEIGEHKDTAQATYIKQQINSLSGTINGYKQALSGALMPISIAFDEAYEKIKKEINLRNGAELITENDEWTGNINDVKGLATADDLKFADDIGYSKAVAGIQANSANLQLMHSTNEFLAAESAMKEKYGVDLATELVELKEWQRMYEANLRVFDVADKMIGTLLDVVAR